jgi:hypothetical protein
MSISCEIESWRPIPSFHYEVSNLGRVRNSLTGRILVGGIESTGYRIVTLCRGGINNTRTVHGLVCTAFHGPRPTTPLPTGRWETRHLDNDELNNRADNLEWAPSKVNAADRIRAGHTMRGAKNPKAKLTELGVVCFSPFDPPEALGVDVAYANSVLQHVDGDMLELLFGWLETALRPGGRAYLQSLSHPFYSTPERRLAGFTPHDFNELEVVGNRHHLALTERLVIAIPEHPMVASLLLRFERLEVNP